MTREQAIELARAHAKAQPQSYYSEPFQPHEWVIAAILAAPVAVQVPVAWVTKAALLHWNTQKHACAHQYTFLPSGVNAFGEPTDLRVPLYVAPIASHSAQGERKQDGCA